jgi:hypothetical protein
MKTVMRPRPAGHGLPWSGPVNGPLDTTDVSSPVTGVSSDLGARGRATGDEDDTAMQEQQQHAGWRNTYVEHVLHVRHLTHVPCTDGLIEGIGTLQCSEGRAAVWSERRSRSEGIGDV